MISAQNLKKIMPELSLAKANEYLPFLVDAMAEFAINNELRVCAFLSQLGEESQQLTHWVENLNYSAGRLMAVWPSRFPSLSFAAGYAHQPQKLANYVYGKRKDLGNHIEGDGWLFRGRGPIQATGRDMYALLSDHMGIDLLKNPDLLLDLKHGFRSAACIFTKIKGCNAIADRLAVHPDQFVALTKKINSGAIGLQSRLNFYKAAKKELPDNLQLDNETITFKPLLFADVKPGEIPTFNNLPAVTSASLAPALSNSMPAIDDSALPEDSTPATPNSSPTDGGSIELEAPGVKASASLPGPTGDDVDAKPREFIRLQDYKPLVMSWFRWAWSSFGLTNITQASTIGAFAYKYGGENWWIYAAALILLIFSITAFFLIVGLIILGYLWFKNRGELERGHLQAAASRQDPNMFNLGLQIEKKFAPTFRQLLKGEVPAPLITFTH